MLLGNRLQTEKVECSLCKNPFVRFKSRRVRGKHNQYGIRRVGCVTCSKECSRVWAYNKKIDYNKKNIKVKGVKAISKQLPLFTECTPLTPRGEKK